MIDVYEIDSRQEFGLPYLDWRSIFKLGSVTRMEATNLLKGCWTLFGFDFEHAVAIFVEVGDQSDLAKAPFCYEEQLIAAKRLAVLAFDQFIALASKIEIRPRIVQLYNIGHCGSTLLHNVFNAVPEVICISEPKVFFDLAIRRHDIDQGLMQQLAEAGLKFTCILLVALNAKTLVIKHFSQVNAILETMHKAEPDAINLFLYRDGNSWANSFYGFAQRVVGIAIDIPPELRAIRWRIISGGALGGELDGVIDLNAERVTFDQMVAVAWALHMRYFLKAQADGMAFQAFRYNELNQQRATVIRQILVYCGLAPDLAELTLRAFELDSHQGTKTARDIPVQHFEPEHYRRMKGIFENPRVTLDPDMLLPRERLV